MNKAWLIFCLSLCAANSLVLIREPKNICRGIVNYRYDGTTKTLFGHIKTQVPKDNSHTIWLEVEFGFNLTTKDTSGELELVPLSNGSNHKYLNYILKFDKVIQEPPKFLRISLNNKVICYINSTLHLQIERRTVHVEHKTLKSTWLKSDVKGLPDNKSRRKRSDTNKELSFFFILGANPTHHQNNSVNNLPGFNFGNYFTNNSSFTNNFHNDLFPRNSESSGNPFLNSLNFFPTQSPPVVAAKTPSAPKNTHNFQDECRSQSLTLIAGGQYIKNYAYPWLGALFKVSKVKSQFLCGATLITSKHSVTAAHCINAITLNKYRLVFGRPHINNWLSDDGFSVHISAVYLHPLHKYGVGAGDIAVLKLAVEVEFSQNVSPICLFYIEEKNSAVAEGVVVGWGFDEKDNLSDYPKEITLPIVSHEKCVESDIRFQNITSEETFCAGSRDGFGPCQGDSGGGFYVNVQNKWLLRGIVSTALINEQNRCDLSNYVVFVDVAKVYDWVKTTIDQEE